MYKSSAFQNRTDITLNFLTVIGLFITPQIQRLRNMFRFSAAEHLMQTFLGCDEALRRSAWKADLTYERLALNN